MKGSCLIKGAFSEETINCTDLVVVEAQQVINKVVIESGFPFI